jgi:hypothetical protein
MATPIGDEGRNEEFESLREEFNNLSSTTLRVWYLMKITTSSITPN